jgi:cysteine desulfurase/selenocysteine lyase
MGRIETIPPMTRRIYADNAATSFPKPPEVLAAMCDYAERSGASAGRGAYREAVEAGELLAACRGRIARLIHAEGPQRIVFALNCTEALNLALRGLLRRGDHVVTTRFEHNSILRPLHELAAAGVEAAFVPVDPATGRVDPNDIREAIAPNTTLIAIQHASNVTGVLQPLAEIARLARECGVLLLVDAAQTIGHVPIDVQGLGIDLLAFPGHKGLLGPLGTGGLYVRNGLEERLQSLVAGGTGSISELPTQPDFMPDKYESGSHNAIGLAGLAAAAEWLLARGVESLRRHEQQLCRRFLAGAAGIDGLTLYGPRDLEQRVGVFSVRVEGLEPAELSAVLESEFGVLTRSGIHCAPWAHDTLGTHAGGGTTRLSFGPFTSEEDVDACVSALAAVAAPADAPVR